MQIVCTQENMKAGLQIASRVISTSSTLPILGTVLLKTENGVLTLSATNLEIGIKTTVRCKVEEEGTVALPAKPLVDLINSLPNKPIALTTEAGVVKIQTDNYHTKLKSLPGEDFPVIPQPESGVEIVIPAQSLKEAIDMTLFATSPNENQPEISGVFISGRDNMVKMAATDRYRLAEKKLDTASVGPFEGVIVPYRAIAEIARIIGPAQGVVSLVLAPNQASLTLEDTQVVTRLIEGQYPPYENILPTNFETEVVVERAALMSALRTTSVFSGGVISAHLDFLSDDQKVRITSGAQDLGESEVLLDAGVTGPGFQVIINYRYLLDCLQVLADAKVIFKLNSPTAAILMVPEVKQDYLYLVQPIKV